MDNICEQCLYYGYDDEYEDYCCMANLDEDDIAKMYSSNRCAYFRRGDDYTIVNKQK